MDDKLDNVLAIDRIKKLQGKEITEVSPEYLENKKKNDRDNNEKEALIKKYVTTPKDSPIVKTESTGFSKGKIFLLVFLVASFFIGTAYGVYVMSTPTNNSSSKVNVNSSAFPVNNTNATNGTNTTNLTKSTTKDNTNDVTNTSKTKSTTSTTTTTKSSNSNTSSSNKSNSNKSNSSTKTSTKTTNSST